MTLDDMLELEADIPAEAEDWDEETLGLDWDEAEEQEISREITSRRH